MSNETVERFKFVCNGLHTANARMESNPDGNYIHYSDHERIVKELEARIWKAVFNVVSTHPDHATRFLIRQLEAAREAADCGPLAPPQPSLSDAIKEVERLRDEYAQERQRRLDLYLNEPELYQDGRVSAAEEIVTALKSLGTQRED